MNRMHRGMPVAGTARKAGRRSDAYKEGMCLARRVHAHGAPVGAVNGYQLPSIIFVMVSTGTAGRRQAAGWMSAQAVSCCLARSQGKRVRDALQGQAAQPAL